MPTEIYNQEAEAYLCIHNFRSCLSLTAILNRSITYVMTLHISWHHLQFRIHLSMLHYSTCYVADSYRAFVIHGGITITDGEEKIKSEF